MRIISEIPFFENNFMFIKAVVLFQILLKLLLTAVLLNTINKIIQNAFYA